MTDSAIKMIATDIDGTMLRSDGSLSPRVKAALTAAVQAGVHVVPVTGRPLIIAQDVIESSELADYWIFANGAVTRHLGREELIRAYWIEAALVSEVVNVLRTRLPNVGFAVEFEETVAFENGFETLVKSVPPIPPVEDVLHSFAVDQHGKSDAAAAPKRLQKVLVYHKALGIDELYSTVLDVVGDRAVASYSSTAFVELAAGAVTKATALESLATDLGIAQSQVACFGDNHNDIPMLEWAGRSFAMGNASDIAKHAADETIASNDEDGLAQKVEDLIAGR